MAWIIALALWVLGWSLYELTRAVRLRQVRWGVWPIELEVDQASKPIDYWGAIFMWSVFALCAIAALAWAIGWIGGPQ